MASSTVLGNYPRDDRKTIIRMNFPHIFSARTKIAGSCSSGSFINCKPQEHLGTRGQGDERHRQNVLVQGFDAGSRPESGIG